MLVVTACFLYRIPMRTSALAFGASIILSTFVLGVHWIPDMIAGFALGAGERAAGVADRASRPLAVPGEGDNGRRVRASG